MWLNVGELMSQSGRRKFVRFRMLNSSARNWSCYRFRHLEILKGSEVPVGISRADIHVAAFRAELPRVGYGIESLVSAGVEPRVDLAGPVIGVADEIGPLGGEAGDLRRAALRRNVVRVEDRKRRAAHQRGYAIQLPSAQRRLIPVLRMRPERKLPFIARNESVARVEQRGPALCCEIEGILGEIVFACDRLSL